MDHLLLNLVLAALQDGFPEVAVVTERVRQGFPCPAFRLEMKNSRLSLELGDRYRGQADFSLFYYPLSEDALAASAMADELRKALDCCPGFSSSSPLSPRTAPSNSISGCLLSASAPGSSPL